jgi:hypothetical protein
MMALLPRTKDKYAYGFVPFELVNLPLTQHDQLVGVELAFGAA